ncbi:hypothetical protein NSQ43_08635 [Sporosarcina sp. FSL W8-0480]|uniref:hypothetical protein n=1 Tax=Sporosarcina sp. FSL W8-0480 TaxID=2954701 RepID=UPI0030D71327
MRIKKLDNNNENEIGRLGSFIAKVFSRNNDLVERMNSSISAKFHKEIYSVQNDEEIIVVASTHKSSWHPYCIYVQFAFDLIRVDEQALLSMITKLQDKYDEPIFILLDDRFYRLTKLLSQKAFRMIRKTEIIHIEPVSKGEIVQDDRILTVNEIWNDDIRMNSLVELCKKTYTETHLDNPVANLPMDSWRDATTDGLMKEHSYVIVEGQEVIGFSLMYEAEQKSWELGWVGVADLTILTDLDKLIHRQIEDAVKNGIAFIEKEVDSTCPYSQHICKKLRFEVPETLYAYSNSSGRCDKK